MPESPNSIVWVEITSNDQNEAEELAKKRLHDRSRQHSKHRPTARNMKAQIRGALGEIAVRNWLADNGLCSDTGFDSDSTTLTDICCNGLRFEVMTAQIDHRKITGFCIPPGKLRAAAGRGAWGYIFPGVSGDYPIKRVGIQAAVKIDDVTHNEPRHTRVSERSPSVLNYVVPAAYLIAPTVFLDVVKQSGSS